MSSTVSVEEITRDIAALRLLIERCNKSKENLLFNIEKEKNNINELKFYLNEDNRLPPGTKRKYDANAMEAEILAGQDHIDLFFKTIEKENATIERVTGIISVLTEDLIRPKEIKFDARTGQVII